MEHKKFNNINVFYVFNFLYCFRPHWPIAILYYESVTGSYASAMMIFSVIFLSQAILEIPTGLLSDFIGRRKTLLIGAFSAFLALFFYALGINIWVLILGAVFEGLGRSLFSGTAKALLYETLQEKKRVNEFETIFGKTSSMEQLALGLSAALGGFLAIISLQFVMWVAVIPQFLCFLCAFFFVEPPITKKSQSSLAMYNAKFLEALREIKLSKQLLSALILAMFTFSFIFMSSQFIQPLLKTSGLQVIYFGVVYALMRAIMGIGGSITHKLEKYFTLEKLLLLGSAGIIISFLGFSMGTGIIIIMAILLMKLSEGFNRIILEDEINKNIKSNNRTTILSVSSFSQELLNAGLVFVFGIVANSIGIESMFNYALGLFVICIVAFSFFTKKNIPNSQ